jgi:hypothetical protein
VRGFRRALHKTGAELFKEIFVKRISRLFGLVVVVALAMLALPSFAAQSQNKTYTLTMCVGTFKADGSCDAKQPNPGVDSTRIQVRLTNTSPKQSNSTINSVDLFPNLNWTIDTTDPAYETSAPTVKYTPDLSLQGHIRVTGLNPIKPQDSLNLSFTASNLSCGDASWDQSLIWSGSNLGGNTFTLDQPPLSTPGTSIACGMVDCATSANSFVVQPTATTCGTQFTDVECVVGVRGSNKDGLACASVPFYVSNFLTNADTAKRKLHFRWPSQPAAAFNYRINTRDANPNFAWIEDTDGNPIPILSDALQCIPAIGQPNQYLPIQYGTLALNVNSTKNKLKVNAPSSIVAPPNFAIVIGAEKMLVTNTSTGTWTVTRGYGVTDNTPHFTNDPVMSTPLPNIPDNDAYSTPGDPGYAPGKNAHMCWTARGPNGAGAFFTDIIDIGDGWGVPR